MFSSVQSETLTGKVSRRLIRSILEGEFTPGELLPTEDKLCEQFGVSRSVIREAMRTVTGIGMARSRQGRGTFVLEPDEWNDFAPEILQARRDLGTADEALLQFLELRALVECHTAELAAQRATPENIEDMRAHYDRMSSSVGHAETFLREDIAFHRAIMVASGNHLVTRLFDLLEPMLVAARETGLLSQPDLDDSMHKAQTEHGRILDAITAGSPSAAGQAMTEHLRWSANRDAHGELRLPIS